MSGNLEWGKAERLDPDGPQSPYAHWWLEQVGGHEDLGFLRIGNEGDPAGVLSCDRNKSARGTARRAWKDLAGDPAAPDAGAGPEEVLAWLAPLRGHECCLIPHILPSKVANANPAPRPMWEEDELDPRNAAVIVAVIDDGIAFANERFRHGSTSQAGGPATRVEYVWMQGAEQEKGTDPRGLIFGRELNRSRIEALLAKHARAGVVDEAALYREAGLTDFTNPEVPSGAFRASHGTAVLDRAAGYDPTDEATAGERDRIAIMAVCLPSRVTHDTSGTFLDLFVVMAIERILQRVAALSRKSGQDYHVIFNLSYALTAGPKDGSGMVDLYMQSVRASRTGPNRALRELFVPAGNHRLSRTHAVLACSAGKPSEGLTWRIQPDDRTPSFVEVWLPRRQDQEPIFCHLKPPGFTGTLPPPPIEFKYGTYADLFLDTRAIARCYCSWHPRYSDAQDATSRQRIVLVAHPTHAAPGTSVSPAGGWTLHLDANEDVWADVSVQRDDTPLGYRQRGRQSYLVDGRYEDYDEAGRPIEDDNGEGPVTRRGTMNAFVSGKDATLVAAQTLYGAWPEPGQDQRVAAVSPYSGLAPPNANATQPSDASRVHRGVRAAGTYSGSTVLMSGTSLAAPAAARELAETLAKGRGPIPPSNRPAPPPRVMP